MTTQPDFTKERVLKLITDVLKPHAEAQAPWSEHEARAVAELAEGIFTALDAANIIRKPHPFAALLAELQQIGAPAPWSAKGGALIDANGNFLGSITITTRLDADAWERAAELIVLCVNTCAGFKLEMKP